MFKFWQKYLSSIKKCSGQSTVEAAVMIPVIFLLLLLLIQPAIILYDLTIMNSAASETCRVLSTSNSEDKTKICENFARRRLQGIPQQDNFHYHSEGCTYKIVLEGDCSTQDVCVSISNEVKLLPLISFLGSSFGLLNQNKCFEIIASSKQSLKPYWASNSSQGNNSESWVGSWLS